MNVLGGSSVKSRGQKTSGMARSRHSKMLTQVHVDKAQRGQANWTVRHLGRKVVHAWKARTPQGFWANHFLKTRWGGVEQNAQFSAGLTVRWQKSGGQQSLGSRRSGDSAVQGLHRVSIIYLLERRRRLHLQNNSENLHHMLLSTYFREELKQRRMGGRVVPRRPQRSGSVTRWFYQAWLHYSQLVFSLALFSSSSVSNHSKDSFQPGPPTC